MVSRVGGPLGGDTVEASTELPTFVLLNDSGDNFGSSADSVELILTRSSLMHDSLTGAGLIAVGNLSGGLADLTKGEGISTKGVGGW